MSLYNLLHGYDPAAAICLSVLQLSPLQIGRFRDAYFDGETMVVLTRTGGGNRKDYVTENTALTSHPLYLSDADDEFDSTFALFRFRFPEEYTETLGRISKTIGTPLSLRAKTEGALADIHSGKREIPPEIRAIFEKITR